MAMPDGDRPLILLVDDDLHFLRSLGDSLHFEGFRVARAMLAEDNADFAARVREHLGLAGHATTVVSDGMSVLELAVSAVPDVIVMKQGLPMMKGTAVASLISVMPCTRGVPVLLYSETDATSSEGGVPEPLPNAVQDWVVADRAGGGILAAVESSMSVDAMV